MNTVAESSIEFLCAFDCAPICLWVLAGCEDAELVTMYRRQMCLRVEAAIRHLDAIPTDLRAARHLNRLSKLYSLFSADEVDRLRTVEHLFNASMLLDEILAERGDR